MVPGRADVSTWVLLRGLTRESRHWGDFPAVLAAALPAAEVVALDFPGNGSLCGSESPADVGAMAEYCRQTLAQRGRRPPYHVLAMSLGAMAAVAWACRQPQELAGAVLINTSLRPFSPFYRRLRPAAWPSLLRLALADGDAAGRERRILELTSRRRRGDAELLAAWIAYRREFPVSRRNAWRQLLAAASFRAPLPPPPVPLLVLAGGGDALVDPACSRQLARRWRTAFAEHAAAGHDLPLDDGAWVAARVAAWLAGAGAAGQGRRNGVFI